jgi:malate synthase
LITMTAPFMRAYSQLAIKTCHRRKVHAMGGMAAQIPIKSDQAANDAALAKVRADKEREAGDGHDGTWVAHPGLVPIALEIFNRVMPTPNQIDKTRDDVKVSAADLLAFAPNSPNTEKGLRINIDVGIQYLGSWLAGLGCVPIHNLMEDAATAEISRSQVWHWIHSPRGVLEDGRKVDAGLLRKLIPEELANMRKELGEKQWSAASYEQAAQVFDRLSTSAEFTEFLTLPLYEQLD